MTQPTTEQEREREWIECADCGAPVAETAPCFPFGTDPDDILCLECAIRRGGQYDAPHDHWTVPPDTSDLRGAEE